MKQVAQLLLIVGCLLVEDLKAQQTISISNISPRMAIDGNIVDAHDGRVIQFGDKYYWYGTSYGTTNGFTTANHYVCYSSDDLISWKKEGRLLPNQPEGVYYRPHVIYNENSKKYVLWYNWYPKLWNGQFGVATSDNPQGPFKIINSDTKVAHSEIGVGDFGLFVDEDKIAYISYNTIQGHQVSVEKLDKTYTSSTLENGGFIAKHMEAGSMFKRGEKYYLLTDYTCCFCNYGSGARVYISDKPLSGYKFTGNINRYPGKPTLLLRDGDSRSTYEVVKKVEGVYQSIEIRASEPLSGEFSVTLFTGNRPENCGDVSNPRVHPEFITPNFTTQVWKEGQWQSIELKKQSVLKSALNQKINISVEANGAKWIRVTPVSEADQLFVSEVNLKADHQDFIVGQEIPQYPIIPAQQTYIMELQTSKGREFIWMGDLWGSASDNVKGHDYQYWSRPLSFDNQGFIQPMKWVDSWSFDME
ncbi:MAG: family 43 glycosylhydrolase [Bacteroidota bacterium]